MFDTHLKKWFPNRLFTSSLCGFRALGLSSVALAADNYITARTRQKQSNNGKRSEAYPPSQCVLQAPLQVMLPVVVYAERIKNGYLVTLTH